MGAIDVRTINQVITVEVEGILERDDVLSVVAQHYPKLKEGGCVWDLRRSDVFQLSQADMEAIALAVASATEGDQAPKSAFLVADPRAYARVCAYLSRQTRMRAKIEAAVFTNEGEAFRWVRQV